MHSLTKVVTVLLFCISWYSSTAQDFPSEIWHNGYAVLIEGDTLHGKVKYDFNNDLIQLDRNGVLKTYAARKILFFKIKDEMAKNYRIFYALPYQIHSGYEAPILFEILYEGKLSLLSREEIVTENVQSTRTDYYYYPTPYPTNYSRERLAYKFFFLEENGTIVYYTLKKNDLMLFFGHYSKQVSQYMKKNNLKHDNLRDLVRITAYYNALVGS